MLYGILTLLYILVSVFLILVVLLQTGKRADLAGAFGGGGSQTAFGARGAATLLTKLTTASAVMFMVLALTLAMMSSGGAGRSGSVLDEVADDTTAPVSAPLSTGDAPAGLPDAGPGSVDDAVEPESGDPATESESAPPTP